VAKKYKKQGGQLLHQTAKGAWRPVKNISTLLKHGILGKK